MTESTSHPEDLLAAFVDGALEGGERAGIEAHLATCDRCREEVRLARGARDGLGALPEAEVPAGTLRPVARSIADREEPAAGASGRLGRHEQRRRDPSRLLAGLAIAAVLVVVGGLVVAPLLRGGGGSSASVEGAAAPAQDAANSHVSKADLSHLPSPQVQRQHFDYDPEAIQAAARAAVRDPVRFARSAEALSDPNSFGAATPAVEPSTTPAEGTAGDALASHDFVRVPSLEARSVTRCVARWAKGEGIVQQNLHPLRIFRATYVGRPATLAFFVQTRSGDIPAKVLVWVLNSDCGLISFVQRAL